MTVSEEAVQPQTAIRDENPLFRASSPQSSSGKLGIIIPPPVENYTEDEEEEEDSLKDPPSPPISTSPAKPCLPLSLHRPLSPILSEPASLEVSPSSDAHPTEDPPSSPTPKESPEDALVSHEDPPSSPTSKEPPATPSSDAGLLPSDDALKKRPSVVSTIGSIEDDIEHAQSLGSSKHRSIQSLTSLEDEFGYFNETAKFVPRANLRQEGNKFLSLAPEGVGGAEGGVSTPGMYSLPPNPAKLKLSEHFPRYKRQYKVESIYVNDLYTLTYDDDETLEKVKSIVVHYRRNDREEIRRKLAMGVDDDQFMERPHRKPSLHSRLQSGMNLQICFMNETASDCESQCSDTESTQDREVETDRVSTTSVNSKSSTPQPTRTRAAQSETDRDAPVDFFARQAQLQAEARMALAQAKEMARMQMEIEKQSKNKSPISEIVRESFNKIGVPFPDSKRRISRQILTDMNVAQLQVIVNDLHTQIESLNEELVTYLMERDDLHMEQDSMLVDIEDLTKHIGAKELSLREPIEGQEPPKITPLSTLSTPPSRSKSNSRLKSIVKK